MIESKMKKDFYIDENKQKGDDLLFKMVNKDPSEVESIENKIPGMNEFKIKRERLENNLLISIENFFDELYKVPVTSEFALNKQFIVTLFDPDFMGVAKLAAEQLMDDEAGVRTNKKQSIKQKLESFIIYVIVSFFYDLIKEYPYILEDQHYTPPPSSDP